VRGGLYKMREKRKIESIYSLRKAKTKLIHPITGKIYKISDLKQTNIDLEKPAGDINRYLDLSSLRFRSQEMATETLSLKSRLDALVNLDTEQYGNIKKNDLKIRELQEEIEFLKDEREKLDSLPLNEVKESFKSTYGKGPLVDGKKYTKIELLSLNNHLTNIEQRENPMEQ
jgi:hypothetical protein